MATYKYHMRIAVNKLAPDGFLGKEIPLGNDVCLDVVLRGGDKNDIDLLAFEVRNFLDMRLAGNWAGIGRGDYVEKPEIVLA